MYGLASIDQRVAGKAYDDPFMIPKNSVALVLGCAPRLRDGRENLYFRYRMDAASELFHHGKTDYLLVSGDNSRHGYNEPQAMKEALMKRGVPSERIVCDYAGFRTLDSVRRAQAVFNCQELTIVTQPRHNQRALYLAQHYGIDAVGFHATTVHFGRGWKTNMREFIAQHVMLVDLYLLDRQPKFYGPQITIGHNLPDHAPISSRE